MTTNFDSQLFSKPFFLLQLVRRLVATFAGIVFMLFATASMLADEVIATNVMSASGMRNAWQMMQEWPRTAPGVAPWTNRMQTLYVPQSGLVWVGSINRTELALIEDRLVSVYYHDQRNLECLRLSVSTNCSMVEASGVKELLKTEFEAFTQHGGRHTTYPPYWLYLETLLGSVSVRGHADPEKYDGHLLFDSDTWRSKMTGVRVQGTNLVLTLEFGTNTVAEIAVDKNIKPVWATTNGVSIGPIPTNCVFYSDVISNKVVMRVVF